jgi:hypothetical protein
MSIYIGKNAVNGGVWAMIKKFAVEMRLKVKKWAYSLLCIFR